MITLSRVYRIEHYQSGLGPYIHTHQNRKECSGLLQGLVFNNEKTPPLHLDRYMDGDRNGTIAYKANKASITCRLKDFREKEGLDLIFAFQNMIQVRNWFGEEELRLLHEHGFNLVVYETHRTNLLTYEKQSVILKKNLATVLWKQNIISLLK